MARINFTALIESLTGKLAGSVFQDSYMGFQIRTRVSPRNPQSYYQQLRRGEFAYITQTWRTLTVAQRKSWIDAATSPSGGLNLFIESNINLSLINENLLTSFVPAPTPAYMPLEIVTLGNSIFTVQASGITKQVPLNTKLLLYATYEKGVTKIFTNPSQYSPIASFGAGADFSIPVSIASNWISRYGQFTTNKRICIKSVLLSTMNGMRGLEAIFCANEAPTVTYFIIDADGTFLIDSDGTFIISQ